MLVKSSIMTCEHEHHRRANSSQLVTEAVTVGLALVPMWFGISRLTAAARLPAQWRSWLDVALSGAVFHLVAEESGLNTWYLTNGHAARTAILHHQSVDDPACVDDWLRSLGRLDFC